MKSLQTLAGVLLAACTASSLAAEGMWPLDNLPVARIARDTGFQPDQAWSDRLMRASARLGNGCSASFVSAEGLLLTNHHCAVTCVEQLSSAERNLVEAGFLAGRRTEELRCPGLEASRLEAITDVSREVKQALSGLAGAAYAKALRATTARLTADCAAGNPQQTRCDLIDLYHGGRYHLYRYRRFQDVRLVFAPEAAIANFGGDPDNFNYPRYGLDMALLRVYDAGQPAAVADFFPFNPAGAAEGEGVFVTGHPGHTERLLTRPHLEVLRDIDVTHGLIDLAERRGLLGQYAERSAEAARVSMDELFFIENSYKALSGRLRTLQDPEFWKAKDADETRLRAWFSGHPGRKAADPWQLVAHAAADYRTYAADYAILEDRHGVWSNYFTLARQIVRGAAQRARPDGERLPEYASAALPDIEQKVFSPAPLYPDYERVKLGWWLTKLREVLGADDPRIQDILGRESPQQVADRSIAGTRLGDVAYRRQLWAADAQTIAASPDPIIQLALKVEPHALAVRKRHDEDFEAVISRAGERLAAARFAMSGTNVYPDATRSLRLSWGTVQGWQEKGHAVAPFTTYGGLFDRATGAAPFALPPSWLAARPRLNPAQRFNMVTTNDIIGGNSGSPLINRRQQVVGVVFDSNLPGLGGDLWYEAASNRSVAVHSGAMIDALDNVYGAKHLVQELLGTTPSKVAP